MSSSASSSSKQVVPAKRFLDNSTNQIERRVAPKKGKVAAEYAAKDKASKKDVKAFHELQKAALSRMIGPVALDTRFYEDRIYAPDAPARASYAVKAVADDDTVVRKQLMDIDTAVRAAKATSNPASGILYLQKNPQCPDPACSTVLTNLSRGARVLSHINLHLGDKDYGKDPKHQKSGKQAYANRAPKPAKEAKGKGKKKAEEEDDDEEDDE